MEGVGGLGWSREKGGRVEIRRERKKEVAGRERREESESTSRVHYCTYSLPLILAQSPNSVLESPQYCISVMRSSEGKQQLQPYAAIPSTVESKSPLPPAQGEGEGGEADSDQGTYTLHTHSLFIGQYTIHTYG